eukprot:31426-Pelagococcus_subviridis.AAC.3
MTHGVAHHSGRNMIMSSVVELVSIAAMDTWYFSPSVSNHPTCGVPQFSVLLFGSATSSVYVTPRHTSPICARGRGRGRGR